MKILPHKLAVGNRCNFRKYHIERTLLYLRKEIYEHLLERKYQPEMSSEDIEMIENNYLDLTQLSNKYNITIQEIQPMVGVVGEELVELGWKYKKSFADTGLFIYSTEDPPPSCFDQEW